MSETPAQTPTIHKVLNIAKTVLSWALVAVAVFMMVFTLISVTMFDKNDRSFFGIKLYTVLSDSMSATDFSAGDIILVKEQDDYRNLKDGQIISFISMNAESMAEIITHKIRRAERYEDGSLKGYVTYGTTTDTDDETLVSPEYIQGVYIGRIPGVGKFFQYIKTTVGYIVCILIPFLLLIGFQAFDCIRLFRRYKAEQMANLQAEKDQIEKERSELQSMMAELMRMQGAAGGQPQQAAQQPMQQMPGGMQMQGQAPASQPMPGGAQYAQQPVGGMPYGAAQPAQMQGQMPYGAQPVQNVPGASGYQQGQPIGGVQNMQNMQNMQNAQAMQNAQPMQSAQSGMQYGQMPVQNMQMNAQPQQAQMQAMLMPDGSVQYVPVQVPMQAVLMPDGSVQYVPVPGGMQAVQSAPGYQQGQPVQSAQGGMQNAQNMQNVQNVQNMQSAQNMQGGMPYGQPAVQNTPMNDQPAVSPTAQQPVSQVPPVQPNDAAMAQNEPVNMAADAPSDAPAAPACAPEAAAQENAVQENADTPAQ